MALEYFLILCVFLPCVGLSQDGVGSVHDDMGVVHDDMGVVHEDTCPCATELEDVMCAAQCQALCYYNQSLDSKMNCSSMCEQLGRLSELDHKSWKWWCSCTDPAGYSEWCIRYGKPTGYIPPLPDLSITRNPMTRMIELEWTTDPQTDPSVVYVVIQIDEEEKFITMLDSVQGLNTYNGRSPTGHCDRPYFCLAAVSAFGSRGLIRPVRTPALVPGSPTDLHMTSLSANTSSFDTEFLRYTLEWKTPLGWSADELKHDLTYESNCPPGPDLDNVVIFHETPIKVKDPKDVDIFQMSGKIPSYAIGCNITFKVSAMSTCAGANIIASSPAVFTVMLRCKEFPTYGESHCEQPEDLEPGPVRDVKMTTVHYDGQALLLISWLPPDNLDESRQLDHYQVFWGIVVFSQVIMDFEVMLGNSSVPKTEFGMDIEINATALSPQETVGVVVETLASEQVLNQPRAAIYISTVPSTPQFRHGKLLMDDGTITAVQNMFPEDLDPPPSTNDLASNSEEKSLTSRDKKATPGALSSSTISPGDDPLFNEASKLAVKVASINVQETPTSSTETPTTSTETPIFSTETPTFGTETPTFSTETSRTGVDIQVVVYWRRRLWLTNPLTSGYLVQWGRFGAGLDGNNRTLNDTATLWEVEVHLQTLTEESLYLHHLQKNTTYWIKVRPMVNISDGDLSLDEWDSVALHTFTTLDVHKTLNTHVSAGSGSSSENPPLAYHTSDSEGVATSMKPSPVEKDDRSVLPISVTVTIVVVAASVVGFVGCLLWFSWKRRRQPSLTMVSSSEHRPYSYFIPGKTLSSMRNSQCPMVADEWELPISCVKFGPILGSGAFGKVVKGRITRAMLTHRGVASLLADYGACLQDGDSLHATVAIKMLQDDCDVIYKQDFLKEIHLMKKIGYHDNIVSMLGCCTLRDPVCLVVEHVGQGDLLNYLKYIRHQLHNLPAESPHYVNKGVEILDPIDLVRFAWHITRGMGFLASKGFVHRDLAARNVLVGNNKVCKIGDFGLTRYVYDNAVYVNRRGGRLPVKWMSVEAIFDMTFSTASDVWSFGIVLFEIVTLGGTPYPTIPTRDLLKELQRGYRLERPDNCSQEIYDIMRQCWHEDAESRPSFDALAHRLENLLSDESRVSYFDMEMHLGQHLYIDDEGSGHHAIALVQPENVDTRTTPTPSSVGPPQHPTPHPTLGDTFQDIVAVYPSSLSEDSGYVSQQKMSVSSGDSGSTPTCESDDRCLHQPRDPDDHSPSSISLTISCLDGEAVVDDVFETLPRTLPPPARPSFHVHKALGLPRNSFGKDVILVDGNRNRRHSLTDVHPTSSDISPNHSAIKRRCRSESDFKSTFNLIDFTKQKLPPNKSSFYRKVSRVSEKSRWAMRYVGTRQRRNAVVVPPTFALDNELYRVINQVVPPAVQIVRKFKATKMEVPNGTVRDAGIKKIQSKKRDALLNFAIFSKISMENKLTRKSIKATPLPEGEDIMTTTAEVDLVQKTEVRLSSTADAYVSPNAAKEALQHCPSDVQKPFNPGGYNDSLGNTSHVADTRLTERHMNREVPLIISCPCQRPGNETGLHQEESNRTPQREPTSAPQVQHTSALRGGQSIAFQGTPTSTPKSKRTFTKTSISNSTNECRSIRSSLTSDDRDITLKCPPYKHKYQDFKNMLCHCAPRCESEAHLQDIGKRTRMKPKIFSHQSNPICNLDCSIPAKEIHPELVRLTVIPGKVRQTVTSSPPKGTATEVLYHPVSPSHQASEMGREFKEGVTDSWFHKRTSSWEDLPSPGRVTSHRRRSSDPVYLQMVSPELSPRDSMSSHTPLFSLDVQSDPSPPMPQSTRCFWFPSPRKRCFGVADDQDFDSQPKTIFPNEKHPSALYLVSNSSDRNLQVSNSLDQGLQVSNSLDQGLQVSIILKQDREESSSVDQCQEESDSSDQGIELTNSLDQDVDVYDSSHCHNSKSLTMC
ncbi:unnamed protein product [Lymnaea stagnalis]|uniref:receptor protein-tyrosine kinase n=1 Tax=Lymnaea stagnalis TaxID=6523 RepID=A0AAV2H2F7_LYMST